jgi:uncharacterized membrane protein YbhN (UPF0104 family)
VTRLLLLHGLTLGLVVGEILVRAVRLRVLLGRSQAPAMLDAIAANAYGDAASAITPARIGGDPARFIGLKRAGIGTPAVLVVLAAERVIDLSLVAVGTVVALVVLGGRGFRDVTVLIDRLASRAMQPWVVAVVVLLVIGAAAAYRLRHRFPPAVEQSLRDALRETRRLSGVVVATTAGLTALSMLARIAILPVLLLAYAPLADPLAVFVGSFALIYSQLFLPTPGGAGGVELGFVVSMAPVLPPEGVAGLLISWRVYSLFLPAGLGVVLLARDLAARRGAQHRTG